MHPVDLERRRFLRLAGQSALFVASGFAAGCGGGSDTASPVPTPTGSPTSSGPVVSRAAFEVRRLFPLGEKSRARTSGRAMNIGGVQGVRLGKINNRGDIAAVIAATDTAQETAGVYRDGVVTPAGIPATMSDSLNYPLDLNDEGRLLVSQYEGLYRLYQWESAYPNGAQRIELPYQEHEYFFSGGINNRGDLVGQVAGPVFDQQTGQPRVEQKAYLWRDGQFNVFDPQASIANDINDAGQILGSIYDEKTGDSRLVLWQDTGNPVDLNLTQRGGNNSNVTLAQDGVVLATLFSYGGSNTTHQWTPTQANGATGAATEIIGLPSGFVSADMNVRRDFVGTAYGDTKRAFRMRNGAQSAEDLNGLIPADSGWVLEYAYGINDAGLITGSGYRVNESGTKEYAAFLLTPSGT